ncbi:UNVERIFIED_CONTAM: Squamosa promoter-binding-like protein 15 [Sesamum radiatum]|uniref:Squamosa promoter-binding-like protein 15 n=1 Tax=Sesamum radiatum TaxID=300843 RepID=A0AAW2M026_SESRA
MMEEVGAQVVAPTVIHQTLSGRFCDSYPMAKKRGLPFHSSAYIHQNASDNWNPKSWDWDSSRFVAKPLQCDEILAGNGTQIHPGLPRRSELQNNAQNPRKLDRAAEDNENLRLKLGGGDRARSDGGSGGVNFVEPQPVSRPNKRVRSGSPGGANYPVCQVDNCNEDLSTAKDYHRRHKVCEVHSKAGKALVGKQMQRFCQQCSRFHPLSEFDEGKRSCRRRLAGHNRRRRKTQPEDSTARLLVPGSNDNNIDIVKLLAVLTRAQGIKSACIGSSSFVVHRRIMYYYGRLKPFFA